MGVVAAPLAPMGGVAVDRKIEEGGGALRVVYGLHKTVSDRSRIYG